jgi:hypothetical protein
MISERKETGMNETKTIGLRLPVQASVDRTATFAALAEGSGVEASQVQNPNVWSWFDDFPGWSPTPVGRGFIPLL